MAILSCNELRLSRSGEWEKDFSMVRVFQVLTDDIEDNARDVLQAEGLPGKYEPYPTDSSLVATRFRAELDGSDFKWKVTVDYVTKVMDTTQEDDPEDPTFAPPQISFGYQSYARPVPKTYNTNDLQWVPTIPIVNSVGDPFNPPWQQEYSNTIITIQMNTTNFHPRDIKQYRNTVNKEAMLIAGINVGIYQARIRNISAQKNWYPKTNDEDIPKSYYSVTYEIEVADTQEHEVELLDEGFYFSDSSGVRTQAMTKDEKGKDVACTEPIKLDGAGGKLAPGGDPVYLTFKTYFAISWLKLGLPREV